MGTNGQIKLITQVQYWALFSLYTAASHIFLKMQEMEEAIAKELGLELSDPHPLLDSIYSNETPSKERFDKILIDSHVSVDARVAEKPEELK